jgi:cell division protein FtsI (penicillin-binding protein 3)/stage V sporulation protein D (sporulation-specific penicillin-binding protein)
VCTVFIITGFLLICGRLYFLQVLEADEIAREVEQVRKRLVKLEAKRGDIVDRNGNLLAGTRSRILLGADPHVVDATDTGKLAMLAGTLDLDFKELLEKVSRVERTDSEGRRRSIRWVPLAEIDEDLYAAVEEIGVKGVYGNRRYERYYPGKQLGAHLIGFINKEQTPVMGVESALDYYLRGQSGWRETEVDGQRQELAAFREREVTPRNGMHIQLTIDLFIQSVIESALQELVEKTNPEGATVIVSDPQTGDILGLANYPTFDPNEFWEYPIGSQRNRAVSDQYEPGSTFKIVTVSAALEEGLVDPDTEIDCGVERREFNGVSIPMPADHRNLGIVPVRTIVTKSSNRGAAQLGMLLGEERMYAWARSFGFGQPVGWALEGAASGSLPPVSKWDGYTISRLPTGYAVGATPMQVHLAMATLANDGVWVQPRLLNEVIDPVSRVEIPLDPDKRKRVVSEHTARAMKEMLTHVVSAEGTARNAELPGYAVAGKTGTARKIIDGQYSTTNHVGSFSGFFPASNPEVVVTVVVDDAKIKGPAYGGVVAAPVFHDIALKLIPHMGIKKPANLDPFIVSND